MPKSQELVLHPAPSNLPGPRLSRALMAAALAVGAVLAVAAPAGASLVCTPRNPGCLLCPLNAVCKARATGEPERFPVKSRLHGGWKGAVYNGVFVAGLNALPRAAVRRYGWHLLAFCRK